MSSLALIIFVVSEKKAFEHFPIGSNAILCPAVAAILDFRSALKNRNLVKDILMIIPLQFGFSQFISFSEKKIFEISANQSILLALGAMLNIRLERKTATL
jgi:hypothetical protein